jgi:prepilin-type N-terminal cleavage/methylation domain-containing protein
VRRFFKTALHGFTLVELLVVVAIIAILAAIAISNLLEAQVRSKVSRAKTDMRSIATALEAYAVDHNRYCPCCVGMDGFQYYFDDLTPINPRMQRLIWLTTPIAFITSVPKDPFGPAKNERADDSDARRGLNFRHPVYAYWDEVFCDALKDKHPESWLDFPQEVKERRRWTLFSYGPDRDMEASIGVWPPELVCYDPSNGTVSNGDIWRFSGGMVR